MTTPTDPGATEAPNPLTEARITEARNPRTEAVDRADAETIVRLMGAEDRAVPEAVATQTHQIAAVVDDVAERFGRGGRLIYVGAGTSGRLGMLDAAECPPTFGVDPGLVRCVIAGGLDALVRSSEGAEDDSAAGADALARLEVTPSDFVLGIATSGTTPFVHGALEEASRRGAGSGFLCCSEPPDSMRELVDHLIVPLVGPEVIAGSTRLKAGTATKLVLNTITTGAMIRGGRVYQNLMVDVRARSAKLVDRSLRILEAVTDLGRAQAGDRLLEAGGGVKTALAMTLLAVDRGEAERLLDACDGFLGRVLDRFSEGSPSYYGVYPRTGTTPDRAVLVGRLEGAPARLGAAEVEAAEIDAVGSRAPTRSGGWSAAQHVGHLLDFERGAVGPRVRAWCAESSGSAVVRFEDRLDDWEADADPPVDLDFKRTLSDFAAERARTLASLKTDSEVLSREARLGEETVTLMQFLRGLAQHDDAHALRVGERVHPALLRVHSALLREAQTGSDAGPA